MKKEAVKVTTPEELTKAVEQGKSVLAAPGVYLLSKTLSLRNGQTIIGQKKYSGY